MVNYFDKYVKDLKNLCTPAFFYLAISVVILPLGFDKDKSSLSPTPQHMEFLQLLQFLYLLHLLFVHLQHIKTRWRPTSRPRHRQISAGQPRRSGGRDLYINKKILMYKSLRLYIFRHLFSYEVKTNVEIK